MLREAEGRPGARAKGAEGSVCAPVRANQHIPCGYEGSDDCEAAVCRPVQSPSKDIVSGLPRVLLPDRALRSAVDRADRRRHVPALRR